MIHKTSLTDKNEKTIKVQL